MLQDLRLDYFLTREILVQLPLCVDKEVKYYEWLVRLQDEDDQLYTRATWLSRDFETRWCMFTENSSSTIGYEEFTGMQRGFQKQLNVEKNICPQ